MLPGGRETSRIGFGCGRIVGGSAKPASLRMIETARTLGIRHFDVAPPYGLGLAEDVLGEALRGDDAVTIATKAGIGRPPAARLFAAPVRLLRPIVRRLPALKSALLRRVPQSPRGRFAPADVLASLDESLKRLGRDRVDLMLLHQPAPEDVTDALADALGAERAAGRIGALGSGSDGDAPQLVAFGTVGQHRWRAGDRPVGGFELVHGVLRANDAMARLAAQLAAVTALGFDPDAPAGLLLTLALAEAPARIVLLSSHHPERLRAAVGGIDWTRADGSDAGFLRRAHALLGNSGTR